MSNNPDNSSAQSLDAVRAAYSQWRAAVEVELKGAPFDKKLVTSTFEGVSLQPVYTRSEVAEVPHLSSTPGSVPFVRGYSNSGYASAP